MDAFSRCQVQTTSKKTINAQLRRCEPLQNAHIRPCMLRFFIGLRLVLECMHFIRWLAKPLRKKEKQ